MQIRTNRKNPSEYPMPNTQRTEIKKKQQCNLTLDDAKIFPVLMLRDTKFDANRFINKKVHSQINDI